MAQINLHEWSVRTVNDDSVNLTVIGQVAMLVTGDLGPAIYDRRTPGHAVEMTRTQLLELRSRLDEALEVIIDEHDSTWLAAETETPE